MKFAFAYILFLTSTFSLAQTANGPMDFPALIMTSIPGAPKLGKPMLIAGTKNSMVSEGMGLAAPAFYDWDGDGLKDLLIGEFGSGTENGRNVGSFIRVFKNIGSEENPEFTGMFDYARAPFEMPGNGTPYSVDQYCCIGFTPQFIDLNNDGQLDMITGQYYGEVSWFKGSSIGFMPGEALPQAFPPEGNPRSSLNGKKGSEKKAHQYYWLYSSASFGDFTSDGKPDLIVGGIMALRMSVNTGSETEPQFGPRELLLDVNNKPLKVYDFNAEELKHYDDRKVLGYRPPESGDDEVSPYVVDWDNDGMLDLLITNTYRHKGLATVDFFKGLQTKDGLRFQQAVPLFSAKNNEKAFPGMGPRVSVTDWNGDGIKDLLIGVSVQTVKGKFDEYLSWNWEKDHGILKDPGIMLAGSLTEVDIQRYKESVKLPVGFTMEDYLTIRHQGYVYVMLGSKEEIVPVKEVKAKKGKVRK